MRESVLVVEDAVESLAAAETAPGADALADQPVLDVLAALAASGVALASPAEAPVDGEPAAEPVDEPLELRHRCRRTFEDAADDEVEPAEAPHD